MPATLNPAARVLHAAPQLGRASREGRCRSCSDGIRAAKPQAAPTTPADSNETPQCDEGVGATVGWLLVALVMVPWLTIALLPVTTLGVVAITVVALCITFPLAAWLSKHSAVVRAIGVGVYLIVDLTLTLLGFVLEVLSVLG